MIFGLVLSIFVGAICLSIGISIGRLLHTIDTSSKDGGQELRQSLNDLRSMNNPLYRYHTNLEQERQRAKDIKDLIK